MKSKSLDTFSSPIFIMCNGEIVFANSACCKAFGAATSAEIIGQHITERLAAEQPDGLSMRASLDRFNAAFATNGFVRRMWAFKQIDGSTIVIRSTVAKIPHATLRCSVAVVEDLDAFAIEYDRQERATRALAKDGTVQTVADRMNATAKALNRDAQHLVVASDQASTLLRDALHSAERTAVSTASISAATDNLSSNIDLVMQRMCDRETRALDTAARTSDVQRTIQSLSTVAERIGTVVDSVSAIANQTQLLALNATIEAARAGEAGRGFAVVASEVKTLAVQSARAGDDIRKRISDVQEIVRATVSAIAGIAECVDILRRDTTDLVTDVRLQRDATHQITRNVQESTVAAGTLTDLVRGLVSVLSENGRMSERLLQDSTQLDREAERLQDEVRQYSCRT